MTYRKPLSIRIVCFVMSIVMVLLCLNDWTFTSKAASGDTIDIAILEGDKPPYNAIEEFGASASFSGLLWKDSSNPNADFVDISTAESIKDGDKVRAYLERRRLYV